MSSGRRAKLGFAVVWGLLGGGALFAQSVIRQGGEFQVNQHTFNNQYDPSVAVEADGDFVVTWTDSVLEATGAKGIWARLYTSAGSAVTGEFHVNTYTLSNQHKSAVASETNGDFVVVWQSLQQGGTFNSYTIFGQRFTSAGTRRWRRVPGQHLHRLLLAPAQDRLRRRRRLRSGLAEQPPGRHRRGRLRAAVQLVGQCPQRRVHGQHLHSQQAG